MFLNTLTNSLSQAIRTIVSFIPQLLAAIVLFIVGIIVSAVIRGLVRRILKRINFDGILEKAGAISTMNSAGIKIDPAEVIAGLVYWFFLLIFLIAAVNSLQLSALTDVLNRIYSYIPQVISALLILFVGLFIAQFLGGLVNDIQVLGRLGFANFVSAMVKWITLLFTILAALEELAIAPQLINILFGGIIISVFAGIGLAIGLAFGLGGRDAAAKMTESMWESTSSSRAMPPPGKGPPRR